MEPTKVACRTCGAKILPATAECNNGLCAPCSRAEARKSFLAQHESRPGCPHCDGRPVVMFNWKMAHEKKGHEIDKYVTYLQRERPLKTGSLYGCPTCDAKWYLDINEEMMWAIPTSRLGLLDEWNRKVLVPPQPLMKQLQRIGATPPDYYGNGRRYVCIPCVVLTTSGERIERALVSFQPTPPIEEWRSNVRLLDDVASIEESQFALPREVRAATTNADEVRMGFAPTAIQGPHGEQFLLNWSVNFFQVGRLKGQNISLSPARPKEMPEVVSEDPKVITYFVGDWFEHVERLRI